jgi:hypothetical protein
MREIVPVIKTLMQLTELRNNYAENTRISSVGGCGALVSRIKDSLVLTAYT